MNEVYRVTVEPKNSTKKSFLMLLGLLALCGGAYVGGTFIPYGVLLQLCALIGAVAGVNSVLKGGAYTVTYVLYSDALSVITRYGFIEKETARFPLDSAHFSATRAEGDCGKIDFYPDEKLKELLEIK